MCLVGFGPQVAVELYDISRGYVTRSTCELQSNSSYAGAVFQIDFCLGENGASHCQSPYQVGPGYLPAAEHGSRYDRSPQRSAHRSPVTNPDTR